MVSKDFKDFLNNILSQMVDEGDSISKWKIIVSQLETNKLCLFIVSKDDNNRYCRGHYGICDLTDENNSISICEYFEIVKFLKSELNIDVVFEGDWYLNLF